MYKYVTKEELMDMARTQTAVENTNYRIVEYKTILHRIENAKEEIVARAKRVVKIVEENKIGSIAIKAFEWVQGLIIVILFPTVFIMAMKDIINTIYIGIKGAQGEIGIKLFENYSYLIGEPTIATYIFLIALIAFELYLLYKAYQKAKEMMVEIRA